MNALSHRFDTFMCTHVSHSLTDTAAVAAALAKQLRPGDCIALDGPMGAGKTTLVRCLVEAMGGEARAVSSPTFTLLNVYPTATLTIYHLDAYRVGGADDFDAIGFDELLEQPAALVIIEWPTRVERVIPARALRVTIRIVDETSRQVEWGRAKG